MFSVSTKEGKRSDGSQRAGEGQQRRGPGYGRRGGQGLGSQKLQAGQFCGNGWSRALAQSSLFGLLACRRLAHLLSNQTVKVRDGAPAAHSAQSSAERAEQRACTGSQGSALLMEGRPSLAFPFVARLHGRRKGHSTNVAFYITASSPPEPKTSSRFAGHAHSIAHHPRQLVQTAQEHPSSARSYSFPSVSVSVTGLVGTRSGDFKRVGPYPPPPNPQRCVPPFLLECTKTLVAFVHATLRAVASCLSKISPALW